MTAIPRERAAASATLSRPMPTRAIRRRFCSFPEDGLRYRFGSGDQRVIRADQLRQFLFSQSPFDRIQSKGNPFRFQQLNRIAINFPERVGGHEHAAGHRCIHSVLSLADLAVRFALPGSNSESQTVRLCRRACYPMFC